MKSTIHKMLDWSKSKLNLVKSVVAGCSLLAVLPGAQAQFTVFTNTWPIYEPFSEYTNATPINVGAGQSGTNWNFGNGTSSSMFKISNSAAMSYPALQPDPTNTNPSGVQEIPSLSNASGDRGVIFAARTGDIYTSFLLNYQDNGGQTENRLAYQVATGAAVGSFTRAYWAVWLTPDYRLKMTKNYNEANTLTTAKFTAATPVLTRNIPHLIVMRYVRVPGNNDRVDLWVDPTAFGDNASIPPPTITTTNGANIASFNGFMLDHRKVNGQVGNTFSVFQVDEIRLGSTWSDVTPLATPAPGPIFAVTGGGIGCPGDSFAVNLSGSVATNDYWLYTNSVYAGITLTGDGSPLSMGTFSTVASYSVLASNNVNGNVGWLSNSVVIYVRAPINIVTQPASVITATNNRAQFTVGVTGDEIAYQWYKTGNPSPLTDDSHLTGSQGGSLIIWPATTADIGSYYCVVTNTCTGVSGVTSSSASLTLGAPANLVWYGDGFNQNFWNLASSAEWNGGAAVFNPGDNVTFDDTLNTAAGANINNLVGVLTPTSITVNNSSYDYTWAGSGAIAGSAPLVKSGTGRLIVSNTASAGVYLANPYTGGTVISNGTVYIQAAGALGTGPITLAGGKLQTLGKLAFSNNVSVTADSVIQLDQSGNQSITLLGPLVGNPGTTLVFTNSSTVTNSQNAIALNGGFTNNSAIVMAVFKNATNAINMILLNGDTNNPQVFNGVISDLILTPDSGGTAGGSRIMKQGNGAAYLNAANTFSLTTTNLLGLLAGSGSVASSVVVYPGASIGGGSASAIGTFTINSNLILNGNAFIRVNKSLAQSNDLITVTGIITNGGTGTITVTNLGGSSVVAGDSFKIFSGAVSNGAALTVADGNIAVWTNKLAIDGTIQVVSVIPAYSTNINYSFSGGLLTISWPETHLGWILQSQTNSLAVGLRTNNWFDISGTAGGTSKSVTVNPINATTFYRLRHP